jgi:hypothetical protein
MSNLFGELPNCLVYGDDHLIAKSGQTRIGENNVAEALYVCPCGLTYWGWAEPEG